MRTVKVTARDVENAALIAEIIGAYEEAFSKDADGAETTLSCLDSNGHCPTCRCDFDQCGHWHVCACIGEALGASKNAERLYLCTSNTIDDLRSDLPEGVKITDAAGKEWIDALVDGTSRFDRELLNSTLEAAAVLREGLLPPGFVLTAKRSQRSRSKKQQKERR